MLVFQGIVASMRTLAHTATPPGANISKCLWRAMVLARNRCLRVHQGDIEMLDALLLNLATSC